VNNLFWPLLATKAIKAKTKVERGDGGWMNIVSLTGSKNGARVVVSRMVINTKKAKCFVFSVFFLLSK